MKPLNRVAIILAFALTPLLFTAEAFAGKHSSSVLDKETLDKIPGETIPSIMRLYSQVVRFHYPKRWPSAAVFRNQSPGHFIIEYIPADQELSTWKDMLTIQAYQNAALHPQATETILIASLLGKLRKIAPDQIYFAPIFKGKIGGYPAVICLVGLKRIPTTIAPELPAGVGEIGLYLSIKGEKDLYQIHRSWKTAPYTDTELPVEKAEIMKWINMFKQTALTTIPAKASSKPGS